MRRPWRGCCAAPRPASSRRSTPRRCKACRSACAHLPPGVDPRRAHGATMPIRTRAAPPRGLGARPNPQGDGMTTTRTRPAVLDLIGNTPMVQVTRLDTGPCTLFLKLESQNPGGSIKDRIGLAMVDTAERDGRLKPGGT